MLSRVYVDFSTVWRRISALSAFTVCIRLSEREESERFLIRTIVELPSIPSSSTTLREQADLDFRVNTERCLRLRCRAHLPMVSNQKIRSPYHSRTVNGGLLQSSKQQAHCALVVT